ncbi:MAG: serine/threonine-protein kinase, partial [Byssovorax sp.]
MSERDPSRLERRAPRSGDVVAGKYVVERVIGSGGMGIVVAAKHMQLGERVALKFLLMAGDVSSSDQTFVARFVREAQLAVRIKSQHVARVLDVGTLEDGSPYMVMELLEGVDLDRLLRTEGPPPMDVAADYLLQACEAVAEAHSLGIVHRDLKPANLFLTRRPDGSPLVKVLDFGISKMLKEFGGQAERSLTRADDVLGSPQYMAPEQVRNPSGVDARCDIFSLGSILYKLLTGRPAFEGGNPATVLAMVLSEPPTPLREHRPEIPPALEALVLGCLEKDPAARVQSVEDLARGLVPFATRRARQPWGEPVPVAAPLPAVQAVTLSSPSLESPAEVARRRRVIAAVGVAITLVTLGTVLALLSWDHGRAAASPPPSASSVAATPTSTATAMAPVAPASASEPAASSTEAPSVATIALPVVPSANAPWPRRPPPPPPPPPPP